MSKFGVICMAFDGEFHNEKRGEFNSISEAWNYVNNMGAKWYFHPFNFVVSESGKTIKDSPSGLEFMNGKRVNTIKRYFKMISEMEETQGMPVEMFMLELQFNKDFCN